MDFGVKSIDKTVGPSGTEIVLPSSKMSDLQDGPTVLSIDLTPKSIATTTVHVFAMPAKLPAAEDTDGIIDWASEVREPLEAASVVITPLKEGAASSALGHVGDGDFVAVDG